MTDPSAPRTLVLVVHGLRGSQEQLQDLETVLKSAYSNSVVKIPEFPHHKCTATTRATEIVKDIIEHIDACYNDETFDRVIIVGYSMGAVLARRAIIEASGVARHSSEVRSNGSNREATMAEIEPRPWASKIERFYMFASISRGWSVEHTRDPSQSRRWRLGAMIGHLMPKRWRPTLFDFRIGSPFIVETRLRWLDYCMQVKARPQVVQFLGTRDDLAPPNDTIDFVNSDGSDKFMQIELPHTDHLDIIRFSSNDIATTTTPHASEVRSRIVRAVFRDDVAAYADFRVERTWFLDELPKQPNRDIKDLVFVLHGIRDRGFWTKKVAARIKERAEAAGLEFVSRTPSYGYFPILPFLLPWYRRQKVEWFADYYVEAVAVYPKADIHFLGHSNGTYLAARALEDYPSISFNRIFFAGSVVRSNFDWGAMVKAKRVQKVFNVVATADWVVAVFTNGLRLLERIFDLGGAGHVGFENPVPGALYQMDMPSASFGKREYVEGGHRAGREEGLWEDIAAFFVTGEVIPTGEDNPLFSTVPSKKWQIIGFLSPVFVAVIATIIIGFGVLVIWAAGIKLELFNQPSVSESSAFWTAWLNLSVPGHLLILGLYAAFLRFMALRF